MKQMLILVWIVLFAVFSAGCSTDDGGTTGEAGTIPESLPVVSHPGNAMLENTTEPRIIPSGEMNATAGPMGPMPQERDLPGEATGDRPMPPGPMNETPGSRGAGAIPPDQATPERSDLHQTGIPEPGTPFA